MWNYWLLLLKVKSRLQERSLTLWLLYCCFPVEHRVIHQLFTLPILELHLFIYKALELYLEQLLLRFILDSQIRERHYVDICQVQNELIFLLKQLLCFIVTRWRWRYIRRYLLAQLCLSEQLLLDLLNEELKVLWDAEKVAVDIETVPLIVEHVLDWDLVVYEDLLENLVCLRLLIGFLRLAFAGRLSWDPGTSCFIWLPIHRLPAFVFDFAVLIPLIEDF